MSKEKLFAGVVIFGLITLLVGGCAGPSLTPSTEAGTLGKPEGTPIAPALTAAPQAGNAGIAEVRVTDAPPTGVSKIMVTTRDIQVHKADDAEDSWINVVSEEKTFDLVPLEGAEISLGQEYLNVGKYTQVRLDVTKVMVTVDGKELPAKLPSEKLKVVRPFEIRAGEKTILTLDFEADKFVVITGKDEAQVKPVIKLEVTQGDRPLKVKQIDGKQPPSPAIQDITVTSSTNSNHTHKLTIPGADINDPPKEKTITTTQDGATLHTHTVTLGKQDYERIGKGQEITLVSSPSPDGHTHTFAVKRP